MTELPPLPPFPALPERNEHRGLWANWAQEYAAAAVLAERERCAVIADSLRQGMPGWSGPGRPPVLYSDDVGAAIRKEPV